MELARKLLIFGLLAGIPGFAQSISCGSGFTSTGACATSPVVGSAAWGLYSGGFLSGSQVDLVPSGSTHNGYALIYQTAVSSQAFTSTFTFIPNGYNLAFVMQNNTETGASAPGPHFASGAGCEGGFYQGVNPGVNYIFALELDSYSNTGSSGSFTYSTAQIYQQNQPPCNPQNGGETYFWGPTQKFSTSPVPLNSPATSQGTTTGDVYSATISFDGSNVNLCMYDVTAANGSCSSGTGGTGVFYQHTWSNVSIPSLVGGTTAYIGLTSGVGNTTTAPLYVNGFTYTPQTATASPTSTVTSAGYTTAANPTFSPAAGSYTSAQSVTISDTTSGAYVCYSLGAAGQVVMPAPDNIGGCSVGTLYSGPVTVSSTETLYAVAGTTLTTLPSGYASAAYTIGGGTASTPTFSPVAGAYGPAQSVTILTASSGAILCYTTNGTTPATNGSTGCTTGTLVSGTVSVASSLTLKAVAGGTGYTDSGVGSAVYTINGTAATPTFSPIAGTYTGTQLVTISSSTSGSSVFYCTTGPCTSGGTLVSGPISVPSSTTLYAYATASGYSQSATSSAAYTINPAASKVAITGVVKFTGKVAIQ